MIFSPHVATIANGTDEMKAGVSNNGSMCDAICQSWRLLRAVTTTKTSMCVEAKVHVNLSNESNVDAREQGTYTEHLTDKTGGLTLGDIVDMLLRISRRKHTEHAALTVLAKARNAQFRFSGNFQVYDVQYQVQSFLRAVWMHIAWMSFELEPAMERLKKDMVTRKAFWAKPATARPNPNLKFTSDLKQCYHEENLALKVGPVKAFAAFHGAAYRSIKRRAIWRGAIDNFDGGLCSPAEPRIKVPLIDFSVISIPKRERCSVLSKAIKVSGAADADTVDLTDPSDSTCASRLTLEEQLIKRRNYYGAKKDSIDKRSLVTDASEKITDTKLDGGRANSHMAMAEINNNDSQSADWGDRSSVVSWGTVDDTDEASTVEIATPVDQTSNTTSDKSVLICKDEEEAHDDCTNAQDGN